MKIGIDFIGGDYAPQNIILGAIESLAKIDFGTEIVILGRSLIF